ncbi:multiple epidermal growth factor-like domains protein 10 [Ruditapes philippinarum]|uniref:multiple epidermal growth factor-like domains protein 10 n=1 Tax=Ruditapes philippinarum TaxID=129788 RepID=UPI00295A7BE5|nr:multiple epidermal growth factor-like domains protein 10 [Ruditapes philippinarum]XP_060581675.1 multiple epidermal growth factor-like domains protein 10 [Ruditapes philippinarum]
MMSSTMLQAFLILVCQFGISMQTCPECVCCRNGRQECNSDKTCIGGCIAGYFGAKCTEKCPENCKTCENEYKCTDCKPGYYSTKCNIPCGKGCLNNTCSITGKCPCKSTDFYTGKCEYCAENDRYGDECNNTCPMNCLSCSSGTYCSICKNDAYYGPYCQNRCSHGCSYGKCIKENGYCTRLCKLRFTGVKCDTCSPGFYGPLCDLNCPGNCSVCTSESNCTQCNSGFYGETCKDDCPSGCNGPCSFTDGRCYACKPNFFGSFCDDQCSTTCKSKESERRCDNITGQCFFGCKDAYHGETCDKKCSRNCVNTTCNQVTAECLYGCINGEVGPACFQAKPTKDDVEDRHSVSTLLGATFAAGLVGVICGVTITLVLTLWRRRNGRQMKGESEDTHVHTNGRLNDDNANGIGSPATYEELKSRDERLYSQITTSPQQMSQPAYDYVN